MLQFIILRSISRMVVVHRLIRAGSFLGAYKHRSLPLGKTVNFISPGHSNLRAGQMRILASI